MFNSAYIKLRISEQILSYRCGLYKRVRAHVVSDVKNKGNIIWHITSEILNIYIGVLLAEVAFLLIAGRNQI